MSAAVTQAKVKETGMIFQPESVRAIVAATKTQTRRVIADAPEAAIKLRYERGYLESYMDLTDEWLPVVGRHGCETMVRCPYGKSGDRIYVKESVWVYSGSSAFHYSADEPPPKGSTHFGFHWHCHQMPKDAARLWLEITNVRVERLQEITNEDAKAEGIPHASPHRHGPHGIDKEISPGVVEPDPYAHKHDTGFNDCWVCTFKMAWDELNAKRGFSWASNPWCWIIEFKKL